MEGDIDRRKAAVNITFHTQIHLDIGLFKHQLLFYFFSVSIVWLILSKKGRSVILNLEFNNCHVFLSKVANQFIHLFDFFIYLFNFGKHFYSFILTLNTFEDVTQPLVVEMYIITHSMLISSTAAPVAEWVRSLYFSALYHLIISPLCLV